MEIDLVAHEGGNAVGEHAYTLTVTDIATGWTENRSVRNKAQKWLVAARGDIEKVLPFPLLGVDSDNGSEFINYHLLDWCKGRKITFTRSRPTAHRLPDGAVRHGGLSVLHQPTTELPPADPLGRVAQLPAPADGSGVPAGARGST